MILDCDRKDLRHIYPERLEHSCDCGGVDVPCFDADRIRLMRRFHPTSFARHDLNAETAHPVKIIVNCLCSGFC